MEQGWGTVVELGLALVLGSLSRIYLSEYVKLDTCNQPEELRFGRWLTVNEFSSGNVFAVSVEIPGDLFTRL